MLDADAHRVHVHGLTYAYDTPIYIYILHDALTNVAVDNEYVVFICAYYYKLLPHPPVLRYIISKWYSLPTTLLTVYVYVLLRTPCVTVDAGSSESTSTFISTSHLV